MEKLVLDDIVVLIYTCKKFERRAKALTKAWTQNIPCIYYITDADDYLPNAVNMGPITYQELPKKSCLMWKFAYEKYGLTKKWFIKIDDDCYVRPDNLIKTLSEYDHTRPWYLGNCSFYSGIVMGATIALSQNCLKELMGFLESDAGKKFTPGYFSILNEDIWLSQCLAAINISPTHLPGIYNNAIERPTSIDIRTLVSVAQLYPKEIRLMGWLLRRNNKFLYLIFGPLFNLMVRIHFTRFGQPYSRLMG